MAILEGLTTEDTEEARRGTEFSDGGGFSAGRRPSRVVARRARPWRQAHPGRLPTRAVRQSKASGPKGGPELHETTRRFVIELESRSGGGALGMQLDYLLDDLLYVGNAAKGNLDRGCEIVVAAGDGVGGDDDVAGAVGTLPVLDGDDVRGRIGLYGTIAAAGDDHDALIGDGVNGVATFEEGPERREDNAEADEKEGQTK